jgi:hypothetical protein
MPFYRGLDGGMMGTALLLRIPDPEESITDNLPAEDKKSSPLNE